MPPNTYAGNRLNISAWASCLALALLASGCVGNTNDELTKGIVSGEHPVAMEGNASYFGGKVAVKVTVSRGVGKGIKGGKGGSHSADKQNYDAYANSEGRTMLGSPLPPVTLHFLVTNTGTDEITVKLLDFDSDLGNFAIDPDTLKIAPGKTAEPTPMVSQLGVTSDEIPFTVRIQLGKTKESQTISVRNLLDNSAAPKPGGG
jgi:hypothetical protein